MFLSIIFLFATSITIIQFFFVHIFHLYLSPLCNYVSKFAHIFQNNFSISIVQYIAFLNFQVYRGRYNFLSLIKINSNNHAYFSKIIFPIETNVSKRPSWKAWWISKESERKRSFKGVHSSGFFSSKRKSVKLSRHLRSQLVVHETSPRTFNDTDLTGTEFSRREDKQDRHLLSFLPIISPPLHLSRW